MGGCIAQNIGPGVSKGGGIVLEGEVNVPAGIVARNVPFPWAPPEGKIS